MLRSTFRSPLPALIAAMASPGAARTMTDKRPVKQIIDACKPRAAKIAANIPRRT
jgi:hypothetical protein